MFDLIKKYTIQLAKLNKKPLLAFINPNNEKEYENAIQLNHVMHLRILLKNIEAEHLEVLLHTPGGDCNASVQIALLLQSGRESLKGYIPHFANSGGTIIALACNELIMSDFSNISPLDTQQIPYSKGRFKSNLEVFAGLEEIRKFSIETYKNVYPEVRTLTKDRLLLTEELNASAEFVKQLVSALITDLSLEKLGAKQRSLKFGEDYFKQILMNNPNYFNEEEQEPDMYRINEIIKKLTYSYHDHGTIINAEEAKWDIGLPVSMASSEEQEIFDILAYQFAHLNNDLLFLVDPISKKIWEFDRGDVVCSEMRKYK